MNMDFEDMKKWLTCGHILMHIENFNYVIQCSICQDKFYVNILFMKHLREAHDEIFSEDLNEEIETSKDNLSLCQSPSSSEYNLNVNKKHIKKNKDLSSNLNEFDEFDELSDTDKDSQPEHNSESLQFNSKKINTESTSSRSLRKKSSSNNQLKIIKAKQKKKTIFRNTNMNNGIPESLHIKTNGFYQCTKCPKKVRDFTSIRNHFWLKHTYHLKLDDEKCVPNIPKNIRNRKDKLFHCTACLASSTTFEALLEHFRHHPGAKMIERKHHKCSYCNSTWWTKKQLKSHELVHTRERKFQCEICSKRFIRKENLVGHLRIHNDDRKHKCGYCDKSFFTNFEKSKHELIHLGLKPHVCETCGTAYRIRSHLIIHMRRHTGKKPSICKICNKSFFESKLLRSHMLIHGEKKFECEICKRKFAKKINFTTHLKIHSEVKSYICEICNQAFKQRAGLYGHIKCVHDKKNKK